MRALHSVLLTTLAALLCFSLPTAKADTAASLSKGAAWLIASQNADGSWGKYPHPAISALAVMALHGVDGVDATKRDATITRGMDYLLSFRQPDGAIYPADRDMKESANFPNYTTSIALLCLVTLQRPQDLDAIKAARAYMQSSQFGDPDKVDYGGVGYGKTGRADLSNGSWACEALYKSEYLDHEPYNDKPLEATAASTAMWAKMQIFLTKCQNLPDTNKGDYVSTHPDDAGGFIYRPTESKAGSRDGEGAVTNLVSSGSMTYAGLMSMVYARLDRQDMRVKAAVDYLERNYTLEENPGMGAQGLYYYMMIMTKALNAYGATTIKDAKGVDHDWAAEVRDRLLTMQSKDGFWVNDNGRFMESMPELATPYAMMTLKLTTAKR